MFTPIITLENFRLHKMCHENIDRQYELKDLKRMMDKYVWIYSNNYENTSFFHIFLSEWQ